jgi:hypothetical protein
MRMYKNVSLCFKMMNHCLHRKGYMINKIIRDLALRIFSIICNTINQEMSMKKWSQKWIR